MCNVSLRTSDRCRTRVTSPTRVRCGPSPCKNSLSWWEPEGSDRVGGYRVSVGYQFWSGSRGLSAGDSSQPAVDADQGDHPLDVGEDAECHVRFGRPCENSVDWPRSMPSTNLPCLPPPFSQGTHQLGVCTRVQAPAFSAGGGKAGQDLGARRRRPRPARGGGRRPRRGPHRGPGARPLRRAAGQRPRPQPRA